MKRWIAAQVSAAWWLAFGTMLLVGSAGKAEAQTWARTYGGTGVDRVWSTVALSGGGFVVVGNTDSFSTGHVLWVVRLDPYGNIIWEKIYEDAPSGQAASVEETASGDLLIAGSYRSVSKAAEAWILRLDPAGGVVCSRTYGGILDDYALDILETTSGDLMVTGLTWSYGAGASDLWVLKLDAVCNPIWQQTYGGTGSEWGNSIDEIGGSQPGFVVAGGTDTFGAGNSDLWILRLDTVGNPLWQKTYGGSSSDSVAGGADLAIRTLPNGFIVATSSSSFSASRDLWVLRLDLSGGIGWQETIGGPGSERMGLVRRVHAGFVISAALGGDYWGLRLGPAGNIRWQRLFATSALPFDQATAVDVIPSGGFIFAGNLQFDTLVVRVDRNGQGHASCPFTDTAVSPVPTTIVGVDTFVTPQVPIDPGVALLPPVVNTSATLVTLCVSPLCPVPDLDGDGILNEDDNCPTICNPSQDDLGLPGTPNDDIGDACDGPGDRELYYGVAVSHGPNKVMDSVPFGDDVYVPGCPVIWAGNNGVADTTAILDDVQELAGGDSNDCDPAPGLQSDTIMDASDNCPGICNVTQADADSDGIGDACCPGIVPGSDYCISGNSTGHDYSWGFDLDQNGSAVDAGEPFTLAVPGTTPVGAPASNLATDFAASVAGQSLLLYPSTFPTANCFTISPPSTGDLYVGQAGSAPICKVTSSGCSYNPEIFCLEPDGSPELTVGGSGTDTDLDWTSLLTGSTYDIVRGDVGTLLAGGGDFDPATEECVLDDHAGNGLTYSGDPASGEAWWFLVRGAHCGGGTYDTDGPGQAAPRDGGIAASGMGCP